MSDVVKPSIEAVLEYYGADIQPGRASGQKIRCPWHGEDRRPSAVYNTDKNTFHCFACPKRGDSYQLIMEGENLEFADAKRFAQEHEWFGSEGIPPSTVQRDRTIGSPLPGGRPRVVRSNNKGVRTGVRRRPRIGS